MLRRSILRAIIVGALFAGCDSQAEITQVQFHNPDQSVTPPLKLEVADTFEERQIGLMYRKQLPENSGMLFIFQKEEPRQFWMKNTYLELDIIFLDHEYRVTNVVSRAVPLTESHRNSTKPAMYAVELVGGSAEKLGIKEGSLLEIQR